MRQIDKDDSKPLGSPIRKPEPPASELAWTKSEDGRYETRIVNGKQEVRSVDYQKKHAIPWDAGWPHFPHDPLVGGIAYVVGLHAGE